MTPGSGSLLGQALTTALALGLVLGLAWLVLRTLRRLQPSLGAKPEHPPQVVSSTALGPRERLVLVRHRNREYLLGVGAGGVSLIDRWDSASEVPPGPS